MKQIMMFLTLATLLLVGTGAVLADSGYSIAWWSVDGGGGTSSGDSYTLRHTIGQADAGKMSGGSYTLVSGFEVTAPTSSPTDVISIPIPLLPSWALISWPINPESSAIEQLLAPIADKYDQVYVYDGCDAADHWKKYDPSAPPFANDLTNIDETMGFWIKITITDTLTVTGTVPSTTTIPLCTGWNLVGYPSLETQAITDALASIEGTYTVVYAYDAADSNDPWKKYDPNAPPFANDLHEMRPKLGYWIRVNQDIDWTVNN